MARTNEEKRSAPKLSAHMQKEGKSRRTLHRWTGVPRPGIDELLDAALLNRRAWSSFAHAEDGIEKLYPDVAEHEFFEIDHELAPASFSQVNHDDDSPYGRVAEVPVDKFVDDHSGEKYICVDEDEILAPIDKSSQLIPIASPGLVERIVEQNWGPDTVKHESKPIWRLESQIASYDISEPLRDLKSALDKYVAESHAGSDLEAVLNLLEVSKEIDDSLETLSAVGITLFGKRTRSYQPEYGGDMVGLRAATIENGLIVIASSQYWFVKAKLKKWIKEESAASE